MSLKVIILPLLKTHDWHCEGVFDEAGGYYNPSISMNKRRPDLTGSEFKFALLTVQLLDMQPVHLE